MSDNDDSTLAKFVKSLNLSDGRINAPGSASVMTLQTIKRIGFLIVENPEELNTNIINERDRSKPYHDVQSRSGSLIKRLRAIRDGYFQGNPSKAVKIPVNVPSRLVVEGKDVKDYSQILDSHNFHMAHWVNNILENSPGNPFVITSEALKPRATRQSPPIYPQMRIDPLTPILGERQQGDSRIVGDTLRDGLSWAQAFFLSADGKQETSELSVQRLIGGPLHSLLSLPGCDILSNQKLDYPDILKASVHRSTGEQPSGSHDDKPTKGRKTTDKASSSKNSGQTGSTRGVGGTGSSGSGVEEKSSSEGGKVTGECYPDLASRPALSPDLAKSIKKAHQLMLQPAISIGEGKQLDTGAAKEPKEDEAHYTVQLAMAAHPSLILLLLLYTEGEEFSTAVDRGMLDEDSFIYSIYYDEIQLFIYAQFPYYDVQRGGWRFVLIKLKETKFATLDLNITDVKEAVRRRAEFTVAIQAVREHTRRLYATFTSDRYKEIVDRVSADL